MTGPPDYELSDIVAEMEGDVSKATDPLMSDASGPSASDNLRNQTLFFRDGHRRIDMILVYEDEETTDQGIRRQEKRHMFHDSLEGAGLELEGKENSFDAKTSFVKIHAPWDALTKYAEMMRIKMPLKERGSTRESYSNKCWPFHCDVMEHGIQPAASSYMAPFSRDSQDMFLMEDRETMFSSAQRSLIVWQVLRRAKYDENERGGIIKLLHSCVYLAAYPLHEGGYDVDIPRELSTDRRLLYLEWARPNKWYKTQPIFLIKKYFGEKIGLYFAWLGFYTTMLIPASIVGVICFIYGLLSVNSKDNIPSDEVCNMSGPGNLTLCPLCEQVCNYEKLGNSCTMTQVTYLFDNPSTVFFAVFMSFWATAFTEMWKRRQKLLEWEWDLQNVGDDEEARPEYRAAVKTYRTDPLTGARVPYVTTWDRVLRYAATGSTVLFMLAGVVAAVFGIIIYGLSVVSAIRSSNFFFFQENAKILTSVSAAVVNLIVILVLKGVYHRVAVWLVDFERHRTESGYEDSLTVKMFVFQFINSYSSILYVAFFKGRTFVHPGHTDSRNSLLHRLRYDVCDPAGCFSELCIQLTIIMVGGQAFDNIVEFAGPIVSNWWHRRAQVSETTEHDRDYTRWEVDYRLQESNRMTLFHEYLEMVLQYGFVTLFVAAFPLAPLFALVNNLIEIRLDAHKFVTQMRRPLANRVQDIGAWNGILRGLTRTAVVLNALVIAFTSDFIPRLVYIYGYSPSHDLTGYIQFSLSEFNTSDYHKHVRTRRNDSSLAPPPTCWYQGHRNGPEGEDKYALTLVYWNILALRLVFVFVFEHAVFALTDVVAFAIPDIPAKIRAQIQEEKVVTREARYGGRGSDRRNHGDGEHDGGRGGGLTDETMVI